MLCNTLSPIKIRLSPTRQQFITIISHHLKVVCEAMLKFNFKLCNCNTATQILIGFVGQNKSVDSVIYLNSNIYAHLFRGYIN